MAERKDYFEEEPREAFNFHEFLIEHEYDPATLNILKRRLWNYRYLDFKHVKKNKESAKALKVRKNSRCYLSMLKLKVGEKMYDLSGLEGMKQFWLDCVEWRKDEKNRDYLLGYQDFGKVKFDSAGFTEGQKDFLLEYKDFENLKVKFVDDDYDFPDSDEEEEEIERETEKLEWMLEKEK